jgi:flagellar hook-basal body complex protein FliE
MLEINATHMPLGDVSGLRSTRGPGAEPSGGDGPGFLEALEAALDKADSASKHTEKLSEQFAAGEEVPVHELMTAIARSDLSLRLTTVATTRAIAAYQEIARLQV